MTPQVRAAVGRSLGSEVEGARPLSGGDINDAAAVTLADGRSVFVKWNEGAPVDMFQTEAQGLEWLRAPGALTIPEVLAVAGEGDPPFLALELIEPGRRRLGFDEALGHGLADLHRAGAPSFGLDHDNFIGKLPQSNERHHDWATFYRACRLEPQLRRAVQSGLASKRLRDGFSRLFSRLDDLVGEPEAPARLHGDLWGGNLHVTAAGAPCLIDPAVYGGHREMDLAMMRLFGGFGPGVFEAYEERWPLSAGAEDRIPLYQLYPLLVHVNLFGGMYVSSVERALQQLV
jgi:fructosamine-3-kinase